MALTKTAPHEGNGRGGRVGGAVGGSSGRTTLGGGILFTSVECKGLVGTRNK